MGATRKKDLEPARQKQLDKELGFEGPLLARSDLMAMLNVSRSSLDRWIKSGYFPQPDYMLGGSVARWKKETVKAAMAAWINK